MTDDDRLALARTLKALGETFNEPVSELRAEAYFFALQDFPIDAVEAAARHAIRHARYFPRPAELREYVDGRVEDNAEAAWVQLVREVRRVGYTGKPCLPETTLAVVAAMWGSWVRLCETLPGEGPELLGWANRFRGTHAVIARREQFAALGPATTDRMLTP